MCILVCSMKQKIMKYQNGANVMEYLMSVTPITSVFVPKQGISGETCPKKYTRSPTQGFIFVLCLKM